MEPFFYIKSYYAINGSCLFHSSCGPDRDPLGSLQLVPVTRIDKNVRNNRGSLDTRGTGNVSDVGRRQEVIFDQPEESAGAIEPEGSSRNRHKKETWLEGRNITGERGPGRWTSTNRSMGNWVPPRGEGGGGGR